MDAATKDQVTKRLKSIEGHVRGIERMVEQDAYCMDVIRQAIAVRRALEKVTGLILQNHFDTCITTAIKAEDVRERERVIGEVLDVLNTANSL